MSDIPLAKIHTVVSMAARGRRSRDIADVTTLPVAVVSKIAQDYGAPDLVRLANAAEILRQQVRGEAPTPSRPAEIESVRELRGEAEQLGSRKLVRRLDQIAGALASVKAELDLLSQARAIADRELQERTAKEGRLAELEAEAEALRSDLYGALAKKKRDEVRAWAVAQGLPVGKSGVIPRAVVVAFEEAAHR